MEEENESKPTTILTNREFRAVIQDVCKYHNSSFSGMTRMLFRRELERIQSMGFHAPLVAVVPETSKEPATETANN
jgi:hypothetical protein